MSILTRMTRLFRADVHGVMDQIEDRPLLLRQCLREMTAALDDSRDQLRRMTAERAEAVRRREALDRELTAVDADIDMAIREDREKIARFLIRRHRPLKRRRESLDVHIHELDGRIGETRTEIANRERELSEIKARASAYIHEAEARRRTVRPEEIFPGDEGDGVADEEVELELIRRRAAMAKGGTHGI